MNNKVVLITGMHRSGTSVIAQWLHSCGLKIGDTLLGPGIGNDDGHFEDADFLLLHQQLLLNKSLPDTGLTDKTIDALTGAEKESIHNLIVNKNLLHEEWGWKEPRTCLFLDSYNKLLPDAFYFVVVRSYNDTVNSLVTREYKIQEEKIGRKKGLSKIKWKYFKRKTLEQMLAQHAENFLRIWVNYYDHLLPHLQIVPDDKKMAVTCDTLLKDDETVFAELTQQWQLTLDYVPFKNIYKQQRISSVNNIAKYISDKNILAKAASIENELQSQFSIHL